MRDAGNRTDQQKNKDMFKRLLNLIKGFLGLFIKGIETNNPEALLEAETNKLRDKISQFNAGLAAHAGMVEKLMSQVKSLQKQETEWKAKTKAMLQAGQNEKAAEYALKFQQIDKQEDEVRLQLEDAETRYKELVRARDLAVSEAKAKIESLKHGINDMKIQNAMADMNEMTASMTSQIGTSADTLNRLEEMVEEGRTKARGRARVAKDSVDTSHLDLKEGEQKALANLALAEFAAAEGITMDSPVIPKDEAAASAPVSGGGMMGPVTA